MSTNNSCTAVNNDDTTGVYAYAACCQAPGLSCVTVLSPDTPKYGTTYNAECPSGYTLTGCNFISHGGAKSAGAVLTGNGACQAFSSGTLTSGQTIQAVATCCKVA